MSGAALDARAIVEGETVHSGVAQAPALLALAEAMVGDDDAALARARERVIAEVGAAEFVDAVAVASNFERMVRIADSIGIPLEKSLDAVSGGLREDLGLNQFGSSANTPPLGSIRKALGRTLWPAVRTALKLVPRTRQG
jgi:hypothetical protein